MASTTAPPSTPPIVWPISAAVPHTPIISPARALVVYSITAVSRPAIDRPVPSPRTNTSPRNSAGLPSHPARMNPANTATFSASPARSAAR